MFSEPPPVRISHPKCSLPLRPTFASPTTKRIWGVVKNAVADLGLVAGCPVQLSCSQAISARIPRSSREDTVPFPWTVYPPLRGRNTTSSHRDLPHSRSSPARLPGDCADPLRYPLAKGKCSLALTNGGHWSSPMAPLRCGPNRPSPSVDSSDSRVGDHKCTAEAAPVTGAVIRTETPPELTPTATTFRWRPLRPRERPGVARMAPPAAAA